MEQKQLIRQYCQQFNMSGISKSLDNLITEAESQAQGYLDYTLSFLGTEATFRLQRDVTNKMKPAGLPKYCDLTNYDHNVNNGHTITRLNQLQELHWMDQIYNIILMGPSGTGKTFISAGLCAEAVKKGYKAYFSTIDSLINTFKMKDITNTGKSRIQAVITGTSCCY